MEKTGKKFNELNFTLEFGGGYGNLCRLIHKLGFQGKYIIFDLPVFSALQKYYLKLSGLPVFEEIIATGIFCINDIKKLIKILRKYTPTDKDKNLFIATWSLSESPLHVRRKISEFFPMYGYYLIGYQDKFGEIDNWFDYALKYLPGHNLLIGRKICN